MSDRRLGKPVQSLKPFAVVFIATLVALVAIDWLGKSDPSLQRLDGDNWKGAELPFVRPIRLEAGMRSGVGSILPMRGATENNSLDLEVSNSVRVLLRKKDDVKRFDLARGSEYCSASKNATVVDALSCHVPIVVDNETIFVEIHALEERGGVDIFELGVRRLKITRAPGYLTGNFYLIALIIFLAVPVSWLLHKNLALSQWFLISVAAVCLCLIQPLFSAALFVFLYALFKNGQVMRRQQRRTWSVLFAAVLLPLGFLVAYKYAKPVLYSLFVDYGEIAFAVPLGISYFMIRLIDVQLRWYRGELANVGFREYLCYVIFPPAIPAGPIETIDQFLAKRLAIITRADVAYGSTRILIGLGKKILIADLILATALNDPASGYFFRVTLDPDSAAGNDVVIFLILSFLYAYIDFSAYSDMSIGLSRLFGYRIRENFNYPLLAVNLSEFWRRWHMSLAGWCMRNIYFSMLVRTRNSFLPLYATMLAVGLWHELSLSWFAWGVYHATGLSVITWWGQKKHLQPPRFWLVYCRPIRIVLTWLFVAGGFSFVTISDFSTATTVHLHYWQSLLGI